MGIAYFTILIIISIIIIIIAKSLHNNRKTKNKLPPGPPKFPFIGNLLWLGKSFPQIKALASPLTAKYGSIYTLNIASKTFVIISSNSLAHQALIVKGAIFADRPPAVPTDKFLTCDQRNINWAFYGPTWLLLRRNLTSNILHPSRIKSYSCARKWAISILIDRLKSRSINSDSPIEVIEHIQLAFFSLLAFMCFGDRLEEKQIQDIKDVQRRLQLSFDHFKVLNLLPRIGKFFFFKRWEKLRQLRRDQANIMVPFIRERKGMKEEKLEHDHPFIPYVDTLLDLQLPEEKRKLEETEIVTLCSEFFTAGTDTTSTALQWIMAYLVKYPHIQEKLFMEIKGVLRGEEKQEVKEDDLRKMPYLKAIVLEGLRLHPPSHFLVPHAVTKDVELQGFLVPMGTIVTFTVAEIGRDPKAWENPLEFKPERFLNDVGDVEAFDITGSREIKMIPFGAGRRMCPGYGLALLHLEYFVANLVWHFNWGTEGNGVDLSEKHEFTTVMANPLSVRITPRVEF